MLQWLVALALIPSIALAAETRNDVWTFIENKQFEHAIQLLKKEVENNKDDSDRLFLLARVFYWNNETDNARQVFAQIIKRWPLNADFRLFHARVLARSEDITASIEELEKVRLLNSSYQEAWELEYEILNNNPHIRNDINRDEYRNALYNRFPNSKIFERSAPKIHYGFSSNYGVHELSNNSPSWTMLATQLYFSRDYIRVSVGHEYNERYKLKDNQLIAQSTFKWHKWTFSPGVGYTPDDAFSPKYTASLVSSSPEVRRNQIELGFIYKKYRNTDALNIPLSYSYLADLFLVRYSIISSLLDFDTFNFSHAISATLNPIERISLRLSGAIGDEAEILPNNQTKIYSVKTASASISLTAFRIASFGIGYEFHRQGTAYDKQGLNLNVRVDY